MNDSAKQSFLKYFITAAKILPVVLVLVGMLKYAFAIEDETNKNTTSVMKLQSNQVEISNLIIKLRSSLSGYVQQKWWLRDNDLYKGDFRQDEAKENEDFDELNKKIDRLAYQVYINMGKLEVITYN